jgi:hypothetical protein
MINYHARTLALLGKEITQDQYSVPDLLAWAKSNDIVLPAAFLEWAQLDRTNILRKYSNYEWFDFLHPEIVTTPEGKRGLRYNRENQGNFDRIVLLDEGDDPPVLFAWGGEPPWVEYAKRFSDAIFAQIFDWQYLLEFDPDNPDEKEIGYSGDIELRTDQAIQFLRDQYPEVVTTRSQIESTDYTEYRFWKSFKERLTVLVTDGQKTSIRITGEERLVVTLEEELLQIFEDEIIPTSFSSLLGAVDFLSFRLDRNQQSLIRYLCEVKPNQEILSKLADCHRAIALRRRIENQTFPAGNPEFTIGGSDWGIIIYFRRQESHHWLIKEIVTV